MSTAPHSLITRLESQLPNSFMEFSLSHSSLLRISAVTSPCKAYSHQTKIPVKLNCKSSDFPLKCSKKWQSFGLYTHRVGSKQASGRHHRRFSIWASYQVGAAGSDPILDRVSAFKDACWRFLRPHTIRGTAVGSTALVARALIENPNLIKWSLLLKAFCGLLALICGNGYIVGINQIYDIGIDKVNKPYLPIAAGDLSIQSAWLLVIFFAVTGVLIVGLNFGPFITSLYCLGLFLGTIYSVPPLRMKRFPVAAFLIIATVWGFLLNFGVYYATRAALGLKFECSNLNGEELSSPPSISTYSSPVAFITTFVTLFALVIAVTKDLPDVEGDRKFQISTFATKLGVRNVAFLGSGLLLAFKRNLMISAHVILASCLIFQAWVLEKANYTKEAISGFYRFIWNLFYAEYAIFPFI